MKPKKILISGASIAGPTLAYWLNRYGFAVTLTERAEELRLGGQNIDVKGAALEIAKKMGIAAQISAATTTEIGLKWVNTDNKTIAEFPQNDALSMTQEHEILRGDLVQILYNLTKDQVNYCFNQYITGFEEDENQVNVTFSNGKKEAFDLVISAEGIGSKTRDMLFENETHFDYKGLYTCYFTTEKAENDSRWARWCNAIKGIVFLLRPDSYGNTRASITFLTPQNGYEKLTLPKQKEFLIDKIKNVGWESDRLIKAIEKTQDLYLERVSQVKLPRWSKGRFAVTGDAAYCATPLAGKGTDLAMSGPYILAGELSKTDNYAEAFKRYEALMRPYAEACQKLPPGIPKLVYPTTRFGIRILNGLVALVGSRFFKSIMQVFAKKDKQPKKEITLPDYG